MTLIETLNVKLRESMKSNDELAKGLLRIILGEVSTQQQSKKGKPLDDNGVKQIIKGMMASNRECIEVLTKAGREAETTKFRIEFDFLWKFIPNLVNSDKVAEYLSEVKDQIKAFPKDDKGQGQGQAMGFANKHLKSKQVEYFGDDVKKLVEQWRAE